LLKSPGDAVRIFEPTLGETLAISRIPSPDQQSKVAQGIWGIGDLLYNAEGIPVMEVHSVSIQAPVDGLLDVTMSGDMTRQFVRGLRDPRYRAEIRGWPHFQGWR
jgi:hypothetical protein